MSSALINHLAGGGRLLMLAPGPEVPSGTLTGADALFVDREGTGLTVEAAAAQIAAARRAGLFGVLRVDGIAADEVDTCLRLAPDALILPQITGPVQLAALVAQAAAHEVALIAQIETVEAVERLEALMAVDGIAGFLIGPFDLARAMGAAGPDAAPVAAAVASVTERLGAAGRVYGLPTLSADAYRHWQPKGAQLLYVTLPVFQSTEFASCL